MANQRLSEIPRELTQPADNDLIYGVDVSEPLPENRSKRLKLSTLKNWIASESPAPWHWKVMPYIDWTPDGTGGGGSMTAREGVIVAPDGTEHDVDNLPLGVSGCSSGMERFDTICVTPVLTDGVWSFALVGNLGEELPKSQSNYAATVTSAGGVYLTIFRVTDGASGGAGVTVNNTLTSDSTTEALSAAQGKALKTGQDLKLNKTDFLEPYIIDLHPEFNTDSGWLPADGIINQVLLSVMNGTDNTDYAPSGSHLYTFTTKASGGGSETSTTTFSTFVTNLKNLGTTAQSRAQFKIALAPTVPVPVKLTLKIGAYV